MFRKTKVCFENQPIYQQQQQSIEQEEEAPKISFCEESEPEPNPESKPETKTSKKRRIRDTVLISSLILGVIGGIYAIFNVFSSWFFPMEDTFELIVHRRYKN